MVAAGLAHGEPSFLGGLWRGTLPTLAGFTALAALTTCARTSSTWTTRTLRWPHLLQHFQLLRGQDIFDLFLHLGLQRRDLLLLFSGELQLRHGVRGQQVQAARPAMLLACGGRAAVATCGRRAVRGLGFGLRHDETRRSGERQRGADDL